MSTLVSLSARKLTCSCDRLLRSHAASTLGSLSVFAKRHVPTKRLLRSHAVRTLGSLSVRKQEHMFMRQISAFSRCKHTCMDLSPCAKRHVHATECCVLTPRAHLHLDPCAKRHVPSKKLLRSHAAPQDRWFLLADARSNFYIQARTSPLRYREPVTRNPGHRAFALQIVDPINVYAVGEISCSTLGYIPKQQCIFQSIVTYYTIMHFYYIAFNCITILCCVSISCMMLYYTILSCMYLVVNWNCTIFYVQYHAMFSRCILFRFNFSYHIVV